MGAGRSRELEKKSSAVTLSDMEVFIFPELMYSLLLANIMSPRLWRWREDPWFAGLDRMKPYRRITRLKQYIIDHYVFNLDLETWGLTAGEREIERFSDYISEETIAQSNALFGYEGDKYYFDMDIRTHFGLDKYEGNIIPYWKTETIEAMDAFLHKPNYDTGAGECVSLAVLYAAAMFVVAAVPLRDIYLMATPLHSQNFIDVDEGILTNNRRLVTRNMWLNGTALSAQARRALENERVTIVTHETGYIHTVYDEATIDSRAYAHFSDRLRVFLKAQPTDEILGNFLRYSRNIQQCFQIRWPLHGVDNYIGAERAFAYEEDSPFRLTDNTRDRLMAEVDGEEFQVGPMPRRIVLNDLEDFLRQNVLKVDDAEDIGRLKKRFATDCMDAEMALDNFIRFCHVEPRLPDPRSKQFVTAGEPLGIDVDMTREEIIEQLEALRGDNPTAELAFYAYRDLNRTEPEPFLLAAWQRNPVSIEGARELDDEEVVEKIAGMAEESIYDGPGRLAQPDEVWNYGRGDGVEKAVILANILHQRRPDDEIAIEVSPDSAVLRVGSRTYSFVSTKQLTEQRWTVPEVRND